MLNPQFVRFQANKLRREHSYLTQKRNLTHQTIIDFDLGYFTSDNDIMAGRIVIPINNVKGQIVAYAGRWPSETSDKNTPKYLFSEGFNKAHAVFNLDRALKEVTAKPLIIVGGFFDVMKLHQCGYRNAIALMGHTLSETQETLIRQNVNSHTCALILFHENEAGQSGRDKVAMRLSKFIYVKVHKFAKLNMRAEDLTAEEIRSLF